MSRWLILVLLLTGCAAKNRPSAKLIVPLSCIHKVQLKTTKCTLLPDGKRAECQHVLIDVGCIKVLPK